MHRYFPYLFVGIIKVQKPEEYMLLFDRAETNLPLYVIGEVTQPINY